MARRHAEPPPPQDSRETIVLGPSKPPGEFIEPPPPDVTGPVHVPAPVQTSYNPEKASRKLLIGVPTLGHIRMEWHIAITSAITPCNWQAGWQIPFGYLTDDAQNVICHTAMEGGVDWLILIEDDVLIPPDFYLRMERWIKRGDVPIVSGLYHLKNSPDKEPLIYRGRGNGAFRDFTYGEAFWVDGITTGCLLIHMSIIKELAKAAPLYEIRNARGAVAVKRIFESPRHWYGDPATGGFNKLIGTSDLYFCDTLREKGILKAAGWPKIQARKYPFLCDSAMTCDHIDRETGQRW